MANRPIFVPHVDEDLGVVIRDVTFSWNPGLSVAQKKRNRDALHAAAREFGYESILEVSSKSDHPLGISLSAFNLLVDIPGHGRIPVECAFQGSKIYRGYGSSVDLYERSPRDAKREASMRNRDDLQGFVLAGREWPLEPTTLFYDWVYLKALSELPRDTLQQLTEFDAFTDIEFNPKRSLNCQARSCALAVAMMKAGEFERAVASPESFRSIVENDQDASPLPAQTKLFP